MCSFVNPHDIVLWPLWARGGTPLTPSLAPPPPIPPSPTDNEDLATKPATQIAYPEAYYSGYGPTPLIRRAYRRDDEYRALYHRLHHDVDGPIDRVRRTVTDGGSDDAVLVLSSDHGDMLGSHGGLHQKWYQLYDECTRVPLQIARIGSSSTTARVVDETPTSHVDLLPTLLGFAGTDAASLHGELDERFREVHPLPGRDLSGVVSGDPAEPDPIYLITRDNMLEGDGSASAIARARGMTDPRFPLQIRIPAHAATNVEAVVVPLDGTTWKLARTFDDPATWSDPHVRHLSVRSRGGPSYRTEPIPDQWELYDLGADPIEAVNRWDDPAAAVVQEHLVDELERLRTERVPARNEDWPYAVRPEQPRSPQHEAPPPPARDQSSTSSGSSAAEASTSPTKS